MLNFDLNETQIMIRDTARDFANNEVDPTSIERDIKGEFAHDAIRKLGELGFLGMMVSPEWGGSGLDTLSYVIAMEEISKIDASVGVVMSVNNSLVCWALETYGTEFQKEKFLKPLASGECIGAYALSEPEAGSDARNQNTMATKNSDGTWTLNGIKNWITNGTTAKYYLVYAQTDKEKAHKGISCFILEKDMPGFTNGIKEDKLGIRSSDTCSLQFQDVIIPAEYMLGDEGRGFNLAMETLNGGRIGIAAQALGIAQGAFEAAVNYSKERKAQGKPLHEFQAIQFKLADMATKISAARALVHQAASLKDKHLPFIKEASMAKLFASKIAVEVTLEAIQVHGGYGYVREYKVERYLRDAKITEIYEGTSEIQHIVIARQLIKESE